ncbi:hypothetical protein [Streptomyces sp. NPDC053079]
MGRSGLELATVEARLDDALDDSKEPTKQLTRAWALPRRRPLRRND